MVLEYMDHDLGGLLNRGVEFSIPEIKCLTKQLLAGTHYMHTNNVVHRDMKGIDCTRINKRMIMRRKKD